MTCHHLLFSVQHNMSVITTFCQRTQPFYGSLDFVWDNLGEAVPEETFTHSHLSWSSVICYLLPPSITIHGILPVQFACLSVFFRNLSLKFSLVYFLAWHPPLHTPYISSPNHCLLFAECAHTIATCFAEVPRLCHLILVSPSTLNLELWLQHIANCDGNIGNTDVIHVWTHTRFTSLTA